VKKISIIIPVYNTEKYLNECISSVLNQTYKNIEVIIINDGSTDNSFQICKQFENNDNRIKVINTSHLGVAMARNTGINNASGEFLAFVDSDDYIHPNMLEILMNGISKNNADISICAITMNEFDSIESYSKKYKLYSTNQAMKLLLEDKVICNNLCNRIFKKELFSNIRLKNGIVFEDIEIMYKLFLKANIISYTNLKLYYYRQRENSTVHSFNTKSMDDYFNAIFNRFEILKELYNNDNEIFALCLYSLFVTIIKISIITIKMNNIKYYEETVYNKFFYKFKEELESIDKNNLINLLTDFQKISYDLLLKGRNTFKEFIKSKIENGDKTIYEIFNSKQEN